MEHLQKCANRLLNALLVPAFYSLTKVYAAANFLVPIGMLELIVKRLG
jgi:hypothetical protein